MATISKRSNGKWFIRFVDEHGHRKTVSPGTTSERQATVIRLKIENILAAKSTNQPADPETQRWLVNIKDSLRGKLVKVGLLDPPEECNDDHVVKLGPFLDLYFAKRNDVKVSTKTHWKNTQRNLLSYFGADKPIVSITKGDATDFERFLKTEARENRYAGIAEDEGLSPDTVRRRIGLCKQFFSDAVEHELIGSNPFSKLRAAVRGNRSRDFFVTLEMAALVLEQCPDTQWRLIFVLARFGGLRCPSEILSLRLDDVDWERERMRVWSPKTEHHEGQESRIIPLFPELKPYLEAVWNQAEAGEEHFIKRYRDPSQNLRTTLIKIIRRAGLEPWPKLYQNLRATRQTELEDIFPSHVVNKWIGNSRQVAERHYLQVTDEHFRQATAPQETGALQMRSSKAPHGVANEKNVTEKPAGNSMVSHGVAYPMGDTGFEPVTSAM